MKKVICLFSILIFVVFLGGVVSATAPVPPCIRTISAPTGDVDEDGFVTEADAQMISEYLAGIRVLKVTQLVSAEVDGDNLVTVKDSMKIIRYSQGMIDKFPVCP